MSVQQIDRQLRNGSNSVSFTLAFNALFGESGEAGYAHLRRLLISYFRRHNCTGHAEDLTDDTISRIFSKASDGQVKIEEADDTIRYALGVAHNVLREHLRKTAREESLDHPPKVQGGTEPLVGMPPFESELWLEEREEKERRFDALRECLQQLSDGDKELLVAYYVSRRGETKRMAIEMNISHGSLRVRVLRIKERLQKMYKRRLEESTTPNDQEKIRC